MEPVPALPLISSHDEAFTVLVVENSYKRWAKEFKEGKKGKDKKIKGGKYTSTAKGQNKWGGWSKIGLAVFKEYVTMNKAARMEPTTHITEKTCLGRLRVKNSIVCNDYKAQSELARSNKRKRDHGVEEASEYEDREFPTYDDAHILSLSSDEEDCSDSDNPKTYCK